MKRLLGVIALLSLMGCATLPTGLDVQTGPELVAVNSQDFAYYSPAGPSSGASQQEIVSGFLSAGTGPQNDYAIAREFLSTGFAQRWQPTAQTLIRNGAPTFRESGQSTQFVDISVGASLDEHGRYAENSPANTEILRFQLIRENGEWRIDSAPNLTVVTQPVFSVVFNAFPVYFVDSRKSYLVPDLRWFPSRASTPTRLVNALLDGPSAWLAPAVTTAIPADTRLTINAVTIEAGVAKVDFNSNALAAGTQDRAVMLSQLRSTLIQIPGINEVALSVNDSLQEIPAARIDNPSGFGPTFVLTRNGISRVASPDRSTLSGTDQIVRNYTPKLFAISDDSRRIAFTNESGVFLLQRDGIAISTEQVSEGNDIVALDFDVFGALWIFPRDATAPLEVIPMRGSSRALESTLSGERIFGAISPEGTRLVQATSQPDSSSRIHLQTVSRDTAMLPLKVNEGRDFQTVIGNPISFSWHGPNAIRVLERTLSGLSALNEYPLTGPRRALTMPPIIGVKVASGSTSISSYLMSEDGELWILTGNTWRATSDSVWDFTSMR